MADITINIYKTSTTDTIGSGTLGGNYYISVKDSNNTEIGAVVADEVIIADSDVTINSVAFESILAEAGTNIVVKDTNGTLVGVKTGSEWIVPASGGPCADGSATINDSLGGLLYSLTVPSGGSVVQAITDSTAVVRRSDLTTIISESILAQASENIDISDSDVVLKDSAATTLRTVSVMADSSVNETIADSVETIKDSAGTTLYTNNILAEGTDEQTISDSTLNVQRSDASLISSETILAEGTDSYQVADSSIVLKESDGTTTLRTVTVKADESVNETIGLATVNVNQSDATLISAETVEAEATVNYNVADSPATVNGVSMDATKATDTTAFEVVDAADGTTQVGSKLSGTKWEVVVGGGSTLIPVKPITGQTTQYSTSANDDGAYQTAGDNAGGNLTDFYTLANPNPDYPAHSKRFTGSTGGYMDEATGLFYDVSGVATTKALAFPNDLLFDYNTKRKWYLNRTGAMAWQTGLDFVTAATVGGESGWDNANLKDILSLMCYEGAHTNFIDERLFNWATTVMWTCTTNKKDTTKAFRVVTSTASISVTAKTGSNSLAYVKNF